MKIFLIIHIILCIFFGAIGGILSFELKLTGIKKLIPGLIIINLYLIGYFMGFFNNN